MTMPRRITSPEDLNVLRDQATSEIGLRGGPKEVQITVHMGTCGIAAGARDVLTELGDELSRASVENVTLRQSGCLGLCDQEPMLTLTDSSGHDFLYGKLDRRRVQEIVRQHVVDGNPMSAYLVRT